MITESPEKTKSKCQTRKRILAILLGTMLLLCILFCAELLRSNLYIKVKTYTIESDKVSSPVGIAVIADLHSTKSQHKYQALCKKLSEQSPDLILLVGDVVSKSDTEDSDIDFVKATVSDFCKVAPVYYVMGNHERFNPRQDEILEAVLSAGGTHLDNSYTTMTVNSQTLHIGGVTYYRRWDSASNAFLYDFAKETENDFSLLLCHNPEFVLWGIKDYNIDLIASGHTHGGMIKLPIAGPLYAPEQGWFPNYAHGLYETEYGYNAITSGVGSSPENMPRFLNPAEIMIIEVI